MREREREREKKDIEKNGMFFSVKSHEHWALITNSNYDNIIDTGWFNWCTDSILHAHIPGIPTFNPWNSNKY